MSVLYTVQRTMDRPMFQASATEFTRNCSFYSRWYIFSTVCRPMFRLLNLPEIFHIIHIKVLFSIRLKILFKYLNKLLVDEGLI